jgi:hypothetical protein
MADKSDPRPGETAVVIPVSDTAHAPFIFYEAAPVAGYMNGIIGVTLSASRTYVAPGGVIMNDHVVVAYLRGSIQAAVSLRDAINNALLLAAPTTEGVKN